MRILLCSLALLTLACDEDPAPTDPVVQPDPANQDAPVPSAGCGGVTASGTFTMDVDHNGSTRTAIVDLPASYDSSDPVPVVINFHGIGFSASAHRGYTNLHEAANDRGWIAVHPSGRLLTWDLGDRSSDIEFTEALLDELSNSLCIDESRIYSTGLSQGGHLSYQIGCDLADRVAAIAPVAGHDLSNNCAARSGSTPVPLMHVHGTADLVVTYDGPLFPSVDESVGGWASQVNDCSTSEELTYASGDVTCMTQSCSDGDEATLCTVDGGGHTWPGASPNLLLGSTTDDFGNEQILDFFARWAR